METTAKPYNTAQAGWRQRQTLKARIMQEKDNNQNLKHDPGRQGETCGEGEE